MIYYLISFLATFSLLACGAEDAKLQTRKGYRCEQDGLCFTSQSSDLFAGAYRKDDLEIEFDVAYRPTLVNTFKRGSSYCNRLLLESQHRWALSDNSNCPRAWHEMSSASFYQNRFHTFPMYEKLVHDMKAAVDAHPVPNGLSGQWAELNVMLKSKTDGYTPSPPGNKSIAYDGDPADAGREIVYGESDSVYVERYDTPDDHAPQSLSSSSTSGKNVVTPSFRETDPTREFYQEIELWSQKARRYLFFGRESHNDHSATLSHVYSRALGSSDPWIKVDDVWTGNHGAKPGEQRMKHYTTCTDLPITKGYYAAGGECEGLWAIEHLCNDDTAYQIWHANGDWNGGNHCLGKRRTNRPWCGKHW